MALPVPLCSSLKPTTIIIFVRKKHLQNFIQFEIYVFQIIILKSYQVRQQQQQQQQYQNYLSL